MDQLPKEQQESNKKLNTDRIRARLTKLGVEEEVVFAAGRDELLPMLAEMMLKPMAPAAAEPTLAEAKEIRTRELELRDKELNIQMEMHRQQLETQRQSVNSVRQNVSDMRQNN